MAQYCYTCGSVLEDKEHRKPIVFGDLTMPSTKHQLACGELTISLTGKEGAVMCELMKGLAVSTEAMMMRCFEEDVEEKIIQVYMHKLRHKLEPLHTKCVIETIWGFGNQLKMKGSEHLIEFGDLILDTQKNSLRHGSKVVTMRNQVLDMMKVLMTQPFVSHEEAMNRFPSKSVSPLSSLRTRVVYLRRALTDLQSKVVIVTVHTPKGRSDVIPGFWLRYGEITSVDSSNANANVGRKILTGRRQFSMTLHQIKVLDVLKANPGVRLPEMAKLLGCGVTNASALLMRLQRRGYARKEGKAPKVVWYATDKVVQ